MKKALSVLTVCISLFVGTASAFASPLELPGLPRRRHSHHRGPVKFRTRSTQAGRRQGSACVTLASLSAVRACKNPLPSPDTLPERSQ